MRRLRVPRVCAAASLSLVLASCSGTAATGPGSVGEGGPTPGVPRGAAPHETPGAPSGVTEAKPPTGLPHRTPIESVALTPAGDAALTADQSGSVRLWPALDGSLEPQPVKTRGARSMRLARRTGGGFTLAFIDFTGRGTLYRGSDAGVVEELAGIRGDSTLRALEVLPGGELLAGLHEDHSIALYGLDGEVLGLLEQRKFRPVAMVATSDPTLLVTIGREEDATSGEVSFTANRIRVGAAKPTSRSASRFRHELAIEGKEVAWTLTGMTGQLALLGAPAISPDGTRAASLSWMSATPADPAQMVLSAIDLATGTRTVVADAISVVQPALLAFSDDTHLVVGGLSSGTWLFDLGAEDPAKSAVALGAVVGTGFAQVTATLHAFARGRRVVGFDDSLYVEQLGGAGGPDERYFLGYGAFAPQSASFSPDGQAVAWGNWDGASVIDRLDGGGPARLVTLDPGEDATLHVELLDDAHALMLSQSGQLRVIDIATGKRVSEISLAQQIGGVVSAPGLGVIAYMASQQTQVIEVAADGTVKGPYVVSDGGLQFGLLAAKTPDEPLLWTLDVYKQILRTYSLAELREGITLEDISSHAKPSKSQGYIYGMAGDGTMYVPSQTTTGDIARWRDGVELSPLSLGPELSQIWISPDASMVVFSANNTSIAGFDAATGKRRWSRAIGGISAVRWSPDGARLAIPAPAGGGAVIDATTGETEFERCGLAFTRSEEPPRPQRSGGGALDICTP